jgi:NitT/TauT family transport system permease protein
MGMISPLRTREWLLTAGLPLLLLIAICAVWQQMINAGSISPTFLPRPTDVFGEMVTRWMTFASEALITGRQALLGFVLAALAGMVVGALLTASTLLREMLYPVLVVVQVLPKVAMAPLFVLWLGTDETSRVAFGIFLSFFPVLIATMTGLKQTDENALRLCRSLQASGWQIFWSVRLPYAAPHIFAGLKVAATLAITGIVVGEFMTADRGLGYLIISASTRLDSQLLFSAIVTLCLTGLAMFGITLAAQALFRRILFGRWL